MKLLLFTFWIFKAIKNWHSSETLLSQFCFWKNTKACTIYWSRFLQIFWLPNKIWIFRGLFLYKFTFTSQYYLINFMSFEDCKIILLNIETYGDRVASVKCIQSFDTNTKEMCGIYSFLCLSLKVTFLFGYHMIIMIRNKLENSLKV